MNGDNRAKTPNTPKVEISVRNFGPIAEADLDLRPLTVFVGPSNTGKTYLSVLIYALHQVFEDFLVFPSQHILRCLAYDLASDSLEDSIKLAEGRLEALKRPKKRPPLKFSDLSQEVHKEIQSYLKDSKNYVHSLETELKRCFDLDSVSGLIRSVEGQSDEITISLIVSEHHQNLWSFKMGATQSGITIDEQVLENTVILPKNFIPLVPQIYFDDIAEVLSRHPRSMDKPCYLPAARSGIMQSHRVIASALVRRSTHAGLETLEIPTLSGVVADFMEQLILYKKRVNLDDGISHIANALESSVLDGQIITKSSPTGYPEFLYRPQNTEQDIRLTRSSSMVSELAPLVLFIRGLIRPGDTLIIEEPEAHLHPAAQTQMAATLARLVRAGVRVIVTTHSDFMLQEIGNLMREGELGVQISEPASWLEQEEVGAWLFQKNGKVKEIEFDRIKGIEPMEYEDVAETLYNRWTDLQYQLDKKTGDEEDKA